MSTLNKYVRALTNPEFRFSALSARGFYSKLSDEKFVKKKWELMYGRDINLDNPQTLCEKLQWLKLYYRKPEFTGMVDKYEAKQVVSKKLGTEYVIPTLGVWNSVDDIDFDSLPDKFVLKPTHDSGGLIICRDKSKFDITKAKKKLGKSLTHDYYLNCREWPYKHVKRRIMAEPLIEELGKPESIEYKTTCFNGKVAFVTICSGIAHAEYEQRQNDHFDRDFNKMDWYVNYKPAKFTPGKPEQWDEIIKFSETLSKDIPYLRVDTYLVDGKILFGEMTFYTWGGFMHFEPEEWDLRLGQMLELPKEKSLMD